MVNTTTYAATPVGGTRPWLPLGTIAARGTAAAAGARRMIAPIPTTGQGTGASCATGFDAAPGDVTVAASGTTVVGPCAWSPPV